MTTEVAKIGMVSSIHESTAKMKTASVRCSSTEIDLSPSIGIAFVGMSQNARGMRMVTRSLIF